VHGFEKKLIINDQEASLLLLVTSTVRDSEPGISMHDTCHRPREQH
jgi:hypothetical protein